MRLPLLLKNKKAGEETIALTLAMITCMGGEIFLNCYLKARMAAVPLSHFSGTRIDITVRP
jgi:hypothetical protein